MTGIVFALAPCYCCKRLTDFCPDCVNSVLVDPETNLPPDLGPDLQPREPDPAAVDRSIKLPICDTCTIRGNSRRSPGSRVETEADRHARHLAALRP